MITLKQMAEQVRAGSPPEIELGDFLDAFYRQPVAEAVADEPPLMSDAVLNSFWAATAESLCRRFELAIPDWVYESHRYLEQPYFAIKAPSFRATLLLESPMEFRSRNLFVTANALSRASEWDSLHRAVAGV